MSFFLVLRAFKPTKHLKKQRTNQQHFIHQIGQITQLFGWNSLLSHTYTKVFSRSVVTIIKNISIILYLHYKTLVNRTYASMGDSSFVAPLW